MVDFGLPTGREENGRSDDGVFIAGGGNSFGSPSDPPLEPPIRMISLEEEVVPSTFPTSPHLLSSSMELPGHVIDLLDGQQKGGRTLTISAPPTARTTHQVANVGGANITEGGDGDVPIPQDRGKAVMGAPVGDPSECHINNDDPAFPPLVRGRGALRLPNRRPRRIRSNRAGPSMPAQGPEHKSGTSGNNSAAVRILPSRVPSRSQSRNRILNGSSLPPQRDNSRGPNRPVDGGNVAGAAIADGKSAPSWAKVARITPKGYNLSYVAPILIDGEMVADIPSDIV